MLDHSAKLNTNNPRYFKILNEGIKKNIKKRHGNIKNQIILWHYNWVFFKFVDKNDLGLLITDYWLHLREKYSIVAQILELHLLLLWRNYNSKVGERECVCLFGRERETKCV